LITHKLKPLNHFIANPLPLSPLILNTGGPIDGLWTCGSRGLPSYAARQRQTNKGGWEAFR